MSPVILLSPPIRKKYRGQLGNGSSVSAFHAPCIPSFSSSLLWPMIASSFPKLFPSKEMTLLSPHEWLWPSECPLHVRSPHTFNHLQFRPLVSTVSPWLWQVLAKPLQTLSVPFVLILLRAFCTFASVQRCCHAILDSNTSSCTSMSKIPNNERCSLLVRKMGE